MPHPANSGVGFYAVGRSKDSGVDYRCFDRMGHSMNGPDPSLFAALIDWASKQPT